jgi:hypothetical protein
MPSYVQNRQQSAVGGRLTVMSEPREETDEANLHPGPRDEGGEGGMATRELAARAQDGEPEVD